MIGAIGSGGGWGTVGQAGGPPPGGDPFARDDVDGSGGLDRSELETLTGKISERSGQSLDVDEILEQYDADESGTLDRDEAKQMMNEFHSRMQAEGMGPPPPGGGGMGGTQQTEEDQFQTLMDLFASSEDEEETASFLDLQV